MVRTSLIALALALAPLQAGAAVLYKSVGKDGAVMFSDTPPPAEARILETRIVGERGSAQPTRGTTISTADADRIFATDEAIARANALVDQAEHELAVARRGTWSPRDGLGMAPTRLNPADEQRISVYRNNVLAARQALMDLLRERRVAALAPREPGAPYVVSLTAVSRPY
jgi:hypothetical protein